MVEFEKVSVTIEALVNDAGAMTTSVRRHQSHGYATTIRIVTEGDRRIPLESLAISQ